MDVVAGATSLRALRSLISAGVECRCLSDGPRLHAKVYIFGQQTAVVTSANLTKNALDANIEVGVSVSRSIAGDLGIWFDALWSRAVPINLNDLSRWEQETEAMRREYATLRKKANVNRSLPNESLPAVRSTNQFRDLMDKAPRLFVCNTNRRYSPDGQDECLMRHGRYAVVWEDFKEL
jgi:hypothetical protein